MSFASNRQIDVTLFSGSGLGSGMTNFEEEFLIQRIDGKESDLLSTRDLLGRA